MIGREREGEGEERGERERREKREERGEGREREKREGIRKR